MVAGGRCIIFWTAFWISLRDKMLVSDGRVFIDIWQHWQFTCVIWDYFLSQEMSERISVLEFQTWCIPSGTERFSHFLSVFTTLELCVVHVYFFKHKRKWFLLCFAVIIILTDPSWGVAIQRCYKTCHHFKNHYPLYAHLPQDHVLVFHCDHWENEVTDRSG